MKNIFLVIIFLCLTFLTLSVKAQSPVETYFTIGDTTEIIDIPGGIDKVFITVVDSSLAGTDTIFAQIRISGGVVTSYSPLAVRNANATASTTYVTSMIPGDGTAGTFQFDAKDIPGGNIRLVRSNESTNDLYAPKTRITVSFK